MKDALGNVIKKDDFYGHSTRTSGYVNVVVGKVTEIDDNGYVSLENVVKGRAMYEKDIKLIKNDKKKIRVLANSLFPINSEVQWLKDAQN